MRPNPPVAHFRPNVAFGEWHGAVQVTPRRYICGYCDSMVGSNTGFTTTGESVRSEILICSNCNQPTYFQHGNESGTPGNKPGVSVDGCGNDVIGLYEEARSAASANAFTATVMLCRKLLMNIAVDFGAKTNMRYIDYVNYLADHAYVSPRMKEYTDYVRQLGNEANHEIDQRSSQDAEIAIDFIAAIIRHNYELPARLPASEDPS